MSGFLESPLVGSFFEDPRTGEYPHNILVESLVATGAVGTACLLGALVVAVRNAVVLCHSQAAESWVALLFIQYLVAAQFSGAIWSTTIFWPLFALMIARPSMGGGAAAASLANTRATGLGHLGRK